MKKLLTLFTLLINVHSFAQNNQYPLWSTPKDSVDIWIDSARARLQRAIGSKLDTTTANAIVSAMRQMIIDSSWRQQYSDTNRYDLTKYQASQLYALIASLAPVATSGSYNVLYDKPGAIPPNGAAGGGLTGFYPNPSIANNTITSNNILDGTIVNADISASAGIDYSKLSGTPTIPTNTNQLTNGANFITGITNTSVSIIFNQTNTATITVPLTSLNVLSGLPTILTPDPTNIKVLLTAYFY